MSLKIEISDCKQITLREAEILLCCAYGFTNKETANKLYISIKTVERHRENLRERLGLIGPHRLTNWAVRMKPELEKWVNAPIDTQRGTH